MKTFFITLFILLLNFSINGQVIDSFDGLSGWSVPQVDTNGSATVENVAGFSGKCLKFSLTFNDGNWGQVSKEFKYIDLSQGDILRFYYKYSGTPTDLYFNINNTEKFIKNLYPTDIWTPCTVDLNLFSTTVEFSNIELIKFVIKGTPNDYGSLIIDKLDLFCSTNISNNFVKNIDNFDSYGDDNWTKYGHNNNRIEVGLTNGINNSKAYKIDFSFIDGEYVLIERYFYLNLSKSILKFKFKSSGDESNLEVKITDTPDYNGIQTTYFRKFYNIIGNSDNWIDLKIAPEDWIYFSSDNPDERKTINLNKIERIWFTISRNDVSSKHSAFYIDDLELSDNNEYSYVNEGKKLIEYMRVDNMSFSPNNDGINDKIKFLFKLRKYAKINLYIFNLKGELVKSVFQYDEGMNYTAGEHFIEWDGTDRDGKQLNNGIYIFKFVADDGDDTDEVKSVVAISK